MRGTCRQKIGSENDAVSFTGASRIGTRFLFGSTPCGQFRYSFFFLLGLVSQFTRFPDRFGMPAFIRR